MANQHIRTTKTEERIRDALTQLLPERGVEGITVSAVARVAGINRGTFYAHYVDKYDLVEQQVRGVVCDLSSIVLPEDDETHEPSTERHEALIPYRRICAALHYIQEQRAFLMALTNNGKDPRLYEYTKEVIGMLIEQSARKRGVTIGFGDMPADYGREMVISGVASVIHMWLSKGCPEDAEFIAELLFRGKSLSLDEILTYER